MSVITELSISAQEFELGRILQMEAETSIILETMVPIGDRSIPFFRLHDGHGSFEETVRGHNAVEDIHVVNSHNDETLYALDWDIGSDTFFEGVLTMDAQVLQATGTAQTWQFELRMPSHEALSDFQAYCADAGLPIEVKRIYNPTKPDAGPWYGLTGSQREMLARAVEAGYYSIPREVSTQALADEFDISDQAVTERLRRGIHTLVTNTLLLGEEAEASTNPSTRRG
jgi:predicted DNA binding protein